MTERENLKKAINDSINKIKNMIKENRDKKIIYAEREKLDSLLEEYLRDR